MAKEILKNNQEGQGQDQQEVVVPDRLLKEIADLKRMEKVDVPKWLQDQNKARLQKKQAEIDAELKKLKESLEEKESEAEFLNRALQEAGIYFHTRFGGNVQNSEEYGYYSANISKSLIWNNRQDRDRGIKDGATWDLNFHDGFTGGAYREMNKMLGLNNGEALENNNFRKDYNDDSNNINEIIDIRHIDAPSVKKIIPGKKGFLGLGKVPDKVEYIPSGRKLRHNEVAINGKDEPVVRIYYAFGSRDYKDMHNRPGKIMKVQFLLPESSAKVFEEMIDEDPAKIREFIEMAFKEKLLKDPNDWTKSGGNAERLRPPWENHHKIYIQKEGGKTGFQQDCIHHI